MEKILSSWASMSSHFIGDSFDLCKPFLERNYDGMDPLVRFVNTQLFISCHLSSESSLILIQNGKEWDADILNRSISEGTIKYIYMMLGNEDERKEKVDEYWHVLPEIASLKRHRRAKSFLDDVEDHNSPGHKPFRDLLLPDKRVKEIVVKYDRKFRNSLAQKWSFTEIIKYFSTQSDEVLQALGHLAHNYGMNSHLIHKDGDGVGMVWERTQRKLEQQSAVTLGHSARVVSDVCTFAKFRSFYLLSACNEKVQGLWDLEQKYDVLFSELKKSYSHFINVEYADTCD